MINWKRIKAGEYVSEDGRFHIAKSLTRLYNPWELHDSLKGGTHRDPTLIDCKWRADRITGREYE